MDPDRPRSITTKYCFVKSCANNSKKNPNKMFFTVPSSNLAEWCRAAGLQKIPKKRQLICEDHLNLEDDLENYTYWKMMASSESMHMKLKPRLPTSMRTPLTDKNSTLCEMPSCSGFTANTMREIGTMTTPIMTSHSVQVKPKMSDFACIIKEKRAKPCQGTAKRICLDEDAYSSSKGTPSASLSEVSDMEMSSSISSVTAQVEKGGRHFVLSVIYKNTMHYIGVPEQYVWLIEFIEKNYKVPFLHVIVTLFKIRKNFTMQEMADFFELSLYSIGKIFHKTVPVLAEFFKQFIYWPDPLVIKKNLPMSFTTDKDFANVQSIIDCFEIEIEKPSNPVHQSLTWSQYKGANTIKYLISMTPDGFVNFISKGFGGRTTDIKIVEESGYMNVVQNKCVVLADRGFKQLDTTLRQKSVKLLRPPSVLSNIKSDRQQVIMSKVIASLRIHIERVIRRVRLYRLLKPHAVVNNKLVHILDDATIIACGLINLQNPILKK